MPRRGNNEGSIFKRGDGLWQAAVSLPGGRRRYLYGKTRQEVSQKLSLALKEREAGRSVMPARLTVGQFLRQWLDAVKPSLRPRTYEAYEIIVRNHLTPAIGRVRLHDLNPANVQTLYNERIQAGLSARTVTHIHAVLHGALEMARRWRWLNENPSTLAIVPRPDRKKMRAFSAEEAKRFLEAVESDRLEALYVLALTSGMRQGELLALRWQDVDLEAGSLEIQDSKTESGRRPVMLTELAVTALKDHRARQLAERLRAYVWFDEGLVFANIIGRPINPTNLRLRSFAPLLAKGGLPKIRFHDLRHSAATLLLKMGVHPKIVSEMLGHSRIGVTIDLYTHVIPSLQAEAAASLDRLLGRN